MEIARAAFLFQAFRPWSVLHFVQGTLVRPLAASQPIVVVGVLYLPRGRSKVSQEGSHGTVFLPNAVVLDDTCSNSIVHDSNRRHLVKGLILEVRTQLEFHLGTHTDYYTWMEFDLETMVLNEDIHVEVVHHQHFSTASFGCIVSTSMSTVEAEVTFVGGSTMQIVSVRNSDRQVRVIFLVEIPQRNSAGTKDLLYQYLHFQGQVDHNLLLYVRPYRRAGVLPLVVATVDVADIVLPVFYL